MAIIELDTHLNAVYRVSNLRLCLQYYLFTLYIYSALPSP